MHTLIRTALAAGCVLALVPSAQAATTVGSTLEREPGTRCAETCTVLQTSRPAGDGVLAAPADGVVVRWRVRTATPSPSAKLRILEPTPLSPTSTASSAAMPVAAGISTVATRLPIKAGQQLGVTGVELAVLASVDDVAFNTAFNRSDPPDGQPFATFSREREDFEVLVNADVEPDTDRDVFGDETQDNCPGVGNPTQADIDGDKKGDACDMEDNRPCAQRGAMGPISSLLNGLRPVACLVEGVGL